MLQQSSPPLRSQSQDILVVSECQAKINVLLLLIHITVELKISCANTCGRIRAYQAQPLLSQRLTLRHRVASLWKVLRTTLPVSISNGLLLCRA